MDIVSSGAIAAGTICWAHNPSGQNYGGNNAGGREKRVPITVHF